VEDCGVVINPLIVDGQVRGGVTQGVGAALLEQIRYDDEGQPASATLMDYLAPTAAEMCPVDIVHLQTPSNFSDTGAKGMGEGGLIGAPATLLNAINDALSGTAAEFDHIPVLPEDVSAALAGEDATPAPAKEGADGAPAGEELNGAPPGEEAGGPPPARHASGPLAGEDAAAGEGAA
jgi:hypothetical protein